MMSRACSACPPRGVTMPGSGLKDALTKSYKTKFKACILELG